MSNRPKPRERIIPIKMESDESSDEKGQGDSFETPSTSKDSVTPMETPIDTSLADSIEPVEDPALLKRTLPTFNVMEKIVLVIDTAEDEKFTPFTLNSTQPNRSLDMLKTAVRIFLHHKNRIGSHHEYALAVLNDNNVIWMVDFTSNINNILKALEEVKPSEPEDIFELNSLFRLLLQKVEIPELVEVKGAITPPPYIVRVILLYARSYTIPEIKESEEIEYFTKAPFFTLDILMTHEPVDNDNNCNKIFNILQNVDRKGFGYFFSVGRDSRILFNSMGKLLGHPLQRPVLQRAGFDVSSEL